MSARALAARRAGQAASGAIRYAEHIVGDGPEFFRAGQAAHLEGIVSKRRDGLSRGRGLGLAQGQSGSPRGIRHRRIHPARGRRTASRALLLGYYDPRHKLVYAGRVGTGSTIAHWPHSTSA